MDDCCCGRMGFVSFYSGQLWRSRRGNGRLRPEMCSTDVPGVEVVGVSKRYVRKVKGRGADKSKKREEIVDAVCDVSFRAEQGQIFGLLGPNASGKTTLMRCLSTMLKPDSGSVHVFGVDVVKQPHVARTGFGYVHQEAGVDKILTGREHLELFGNLAHLDQETIKRNSERLISVLNMEEFIDLQTGVYSGGIKRRLDIALALLHDPGLLLLDEPTTGLDLDSRRVIWGLLREFSSNGGCVLLTSHYLEEVDTLADKVAIMDKGSVIATGKPSELKDSLGGSRVQIRLEEFTRHEQAQYALDVLRASGNVREGLINEAIGNALELVVSDVEVAHLIDLLRRNGFPHVFSFSQSGTSLGDVYLSATGRSIEAADAMAKGTRDPKQTKKEIQV